MVDSHDPAADEGASKQASSLDTNTTPSRRTFLAGAGAAAAAALTAAACRADEASEPVGDAVPAPSEPQAASVEGIAAGQADQVTASQADAETIEAEPVAFSGAHQLGVLVAPLNAGLVAAFDVAVGSTAELATLMQDLSAEIQRMMLNTPLEQTDEFLPPIDSGAIGHELGTAGVTVTVAVGASLFDDRFGLADQRPRELIPMPQFFNDRLVRSELSHGDLAITVGAPNQQAATFALHQIVRVTERRLRLRWVQEGYNQLLPEEAGAKAETRNLMGFRDGTSNLDVSDTAQMDEFVWVGASDGEPDWAVGGTYQATRIIRMLIEFWATAALVRQEQIFGRHRDSGAPLGQSDERDTPTFVSNPADETIPRRSHMRLANPRTAEAARILRRGYSYLNGAAADATLDQGLLFTCYQRSLTRGFLEVQSRLDGEPLEDYIKPVGGGLFFILPGPGSGWIGESLLA